MRSRPVWPSAPTTSTTPLFSACHSPAQAVRLQEGPIQALELATATVLSSAPSDFSLFSYNNGVVMTSCRELDSTRSALSAASAFAIATAGANEGTPTKEKYRRMSLASAGTLPWGTPSWAAHSYCPCLGDNPQSIPSPAPTHAGCLSILKVGDAWGDLAALRSAPEHQGEGS